MSEQELDEIVQITVEDFNQDDRTGKHMKRYYFSMYSNQCVAFQSGHPIVKSNKKAVVLF